MIDREATAALADAPRYRHIAEEHPGIGAAAATMPVRSLAPSKPTFWKLKPSTPAPVSLRPKTPLLLSLSPKTPTPSSCPPSDPVPYTPTGPAGAVFDPFTPPATPTIGPAP